MKLIIENVITMIKKDFEDLSQEPNSVQFEYIQELERCLEQIDAVHQNLDQLPQDNQFVSHAKTLLNL